MRWIAAGALVAGAATTIGSLFATWANDGPAAGREAAATGWEWMLYGDVALAVHAGATLLLAAALWSRARMLLAVGALAVAGVCLAAAWGVSIVVMFTEWAIFEPSSYVAGSGPAVALAGLAMIVVGTGLALAVGAQRVGEVWQPPSRERRLLR